MAMGEDGIRRLLPAVLVGGVFLAALGGTSAFAASPGAQTRGDAQAAFEAFFTGGASIRAHNPNAEGAPGVPVEPPLDSARIYPGLDDVEYCEQGWHVVMLGIFDDPAAYPGGKQQLVDDLSSVDMQFLIDGVPLEMDRTAIKRIQHPPPDISEVPLIVLNFGAFLPPGSLSVGTHELRTIVHDPVFGDADFTITFSVVLC
jgi:hypothetical protein